MIELRNKRMLVTAGSTAMPIDKVRILTNIFHGRTGENIARAAAGSGWQVTLLSSAPRALEGSDHPLLKRRRYRTYDELAALMQDEITTGGYDAIVHSAAVSDFRLSRVHVMGADGFLQPLLAVGSSAAKIPSSHDRLFLELVPTVKLIDLIREPWGFRGTLIKFKLQADMSDFELLEVARRSLAHSRADLLVANCLEWCDSHAYILDAAGGAEKVSRNELPASLVRRLT